MATAAVALRVLYVEDNRVDADLVSRELARLAPEMRLEIAGTLGRALELLAPAGDMFDVVLTDLSLPDGSGLELISHCRGRDLPPALVIMTGSGDQEAAVAALKAGADDYLVKRPELIRHLPRMLRAAYDASRQKLRRRTRPLRLLYAEPNHVDVDLTRRYLAQHALNVRAEFVGCGEEVLARLPMTGEQGPGKYDVLLLDYRLPGINALEVVKELRRERGLDIPIVLVTGHGSEDAAVQALRLGADDYLTKHEGYLQLLPVILEKMEKQAELNRSEERYRTLFENSQAVMLVIDPLHGEVVDANPAAAAWYGWSREQLCRKNMSEIDVVPTPGTYPEAPPGWKQGHFQGHHRRADGSRREVEVFGSPVAMAGRSLFYCIVHDITEKKFAEDELLRSEREFRRLSQEFHGLLDAIPDSLMLLDRDLHVLWVNRAGAESLGAPMEELAGRYCYELWYGRSAPCESCPVLQSFQSGLPGQQTVTRDSDGRTWDIRTAPLPDERGDVANVIELRRDITDHRKMEQQYLHAQKMESIGTLAGGVAHDFNNILTVVSGLSQLTLDKMAQDDPLRANMAGIMEASERAGYLTRELLLFSRKQKSERRPVDLNQVVAKMQNFLHRIIGEDIALKQLPLGDPLPILADRNQLEQVLMNLAVNARDAMPQGGEFVLRTDQVQLQDDFASTYGYGRSGEYALLSVSDTGVGMDQETLQRVFEPFFSTKEVGKGTGLGLSVVYGIIKQHEGFITAYSEPGQGSTFRVYFPLGTPAPNECPVPLELSAIGGSETILLAEDNDLVRKLLTSVLTEAGYSVIGAADGEEAVREFRLHAGSIQLLLFDLIMPKMSGKDASDEIHKTHPAIKTIFASGYAPEIAMQKAKLADGACLLYKPVSQQDLLKMVRSVLDGTC